LAAVIYYPFGAEHVNVQSRLQSPNIDAVAFAGESEESVNAAVGLVLAKLGGRRQPGCRPQMRKGESATPETYPGWRMRPFTLWSRRRHIGVSRGTTSVRGNSATSRITRLFWTSSRKRWRSATECSCPVDGSCAWSGVYVCRAVRTAD